MTASITLDTAIRANEDALFQDLQGEGVLLNLKSAVYFGLDPVGAQVWRLIEKPTVLSEVHAALLAIYDVSHERCAADLLELVAQLEAHGLVTLRQAEGQ